MKTAISIPDPVFEGAEKLAKEMHVSRSKFYTAAILHFIEFHEKGGVTGALDRVYSKQNTKVDATLSKMQIKSVSEQW